MAQSVNNSSSNSANSTKNFQFISPSINYTGGYSTAYTKDLFSSFESDDIIFYLKESELLEILEKVRSRATKDEFVKLTLNIISKRHFSEEFILKFVPEEYERYKTSFEGAVLAYHYNDIKSTEYSQLSLLFELKK